MGKLRDVDMARENMKSILFFSSMHFFVCLGLMWVQYLSWLGEQLGVVPEITVHIIGWVLRVLTFPFSAMIWVVELNEMHMFAAGTSVVILLFSSCFWGLIELWLYSHSKRLDLIVLK